MTMKKLVRAQKSATFAALCTAAFCGAAFAGSIGVDIYPSRLGLTSGGSGSDDFNYYGQATVDGETYSAFSMANTSCNIGDQVAQWIDTPNNARNPLIAPNIYRIYNGRMQHIGMGWPKHSFCAVSEPTCGSCQSTQAAVSVSF